MSSQLRYTKTPDLRLRPLKEHGYLLVFTPSRPKLHWLNLNAWLIFELCDGKTEEQLRQAYLAAVSRKLSPDEAWSQLQAGLTQLERIDVVRKSEAKEVYT
jgi:hypothetical protein